MRRKRRVREVGFFFVLFITMGTILSLARANLVKSGGVKEIDIPDYFEISVDASQHDDYGLSYPVTYQFSIIPGSSNLKAYKKYTESEKWAEITEKTSEDFFNGVEAVRFNDTNSKAYVSIAFNESSEEIFLKIIDGSGNSVATYDKIPKYYDNRDAAVVFSADDWCGSSIIDSKFQQACDMFTSKKIWLSVGVITHGFRNDSIWGDQPPPIWSHIQEKIDKGYIEVVSHSQTHSYSFPYVYEVGGSKEDIIENLDLPSLYKKGTQEYVWGWTAPYGYFDNILRSKLGEYKYMSDVAGSFYGQEGDFPDWDSVNGLYEKWNRWSYIEWQRLSNLNTEFNRRTSAGKIYHIGFHPWAIDLSPGSRIDRHTDYVKGRTNLWYVGHGALMIYHYVEDQNIVTVQEKYGPQTLEEVFSYPNPCYPDRGQVVKIVNLPLNIEKIYIYTTNGELVRSLEKGDEIEESPRYAIATWDCRNENGEKVARGIYVYLAATTEGKKRVGKIAVVK